jgi:hypothetical protein
VGAQLAVQILLARFRVPPAHLNSPSAGHMIRAIAQVIFFHFDSSASSCLFPAAVSR